jgi:hypothetical protein
MLILQNCKFLCTPKTGSMFVTEALKRSCKVVDDSRSYHCQLNNCSDVKLPSIAFVRHPLTWFPSYWNHRMRTGWRKERDIVLFEPEGSVALDRKCGSNKFPVFMKRVLEECPGYLSRRLPAWIGFHKQPIEFIGKYECLVEDLCFALRYFNEPFDESALRSTSPTNVSDYKKHPVVWEPDLAKSVCESENLILDRFYV